MNQEGGSVRESMALSALLDHSQRAIGTTVWTCEQWSEEACNFVRKKLGFEKLAEVRSSHLRKLIGAAEELVVVEGNLMLNEGIQYLLDLGIGAQTTNQWNNANSRIGVGDSVTAEAATQTDLQAATNKTYKGMNATFPSRAGQTVTFQSDFVTGEANYDWEEWVIDNGATSGKTLNRKVTSLGTKSSGTWTFSGAFLIA